MPFLSHRRPPTCRASQAPRSGSLGTMPFGRLLDRAFLICTAPLLGLVAGCGTGTPFAADPVTAPGPGAMRVNGTVHGGQQPIAGSTVQLWQVGTGGYGVGAAPLGTSARTDPNGNFSLTGNYSCSNAANGGNTLVYLTAAGGNPGLPGLADNAAVLMMAPLGTCGSLTSSTFTSINEVTTVGSAYALAQFLSTAGGVGSYGTSTRGLTNAFSTVNNLVSTSLGVALTKTPAGNGIAPQAKLNTLADILAPCVNSSGPASATCTALFSAATPPGGVAPTTIFGAALAIALNPGNNVAQLLNQVDTRAPFQPTVPSANDWTLAIGWSSGGSKPSGLALDSGGNVWVSNYATGGSSSSVSLLTATGAPATNAPFSQAGVVNGASAIAIDQNDNAWIANRDGNSATQLSAAANGSAYTITPVAGPFNASGLSAPTAIAIDAASNVWLVNSSVNSVTELNHANYAGASLNLNSLGLSGPQAIAFDSVGNAWITDGAGGSLAEFNPGVSPLAASLFTGGGLSNPAGLAIDRAGSIWVTDAQLGQVAEFSNAGFALSPVGGDSGGGLTASQSDAIDGSGNVWVADKSGSRLSALDSGGNAITPATGFRDSSFSSPAGLAIDASGNIWVANSSPVVNGALSLTLTEVVGVAAPVVTPLSQAVRGAQLALKPGTPQPVANIAGPITGTAGVAVAFNGSASTDPVNKTLTFSWTFGDGTGGSGASPSHTYLAPGTYAVTLLVTNTDGIHGVAGASAVIAATPVLAPQVKTGGPYTGNAGVGLNFNGSASSDPSNPTGGPFALTFTWNFGDGSQAFGATPTHTYAQAGTYTVSLTAQSASGGTATATTSATVGPASPVAGSPTANAGGPYTGVARTAVAFSGASSSDPNQATLTYHWDFGDGTSNDTGSTTTHTYLVAGTYSVSLYVFNGTSGNSASTTATMTAAPQAALVVSAGGPYTVAVNQALTVDGSRTTDPSGRQLTYTWDFGDGGTRTGAQATYIYAQSGKYTITLSVSDGAALAASARTQVTVTGPAAETIKASAGGPYADTTGHAIVFDASSTSDNLGNPVTYAWNFGDGTAGSGTTPTHTYSTRGNYTATVTASSGSLTASATAPVVITAVINVVLTSPAPNALFGTNTITVTGTTSVPNLSVVVNGVAASVSGTSFTASAISLREGVNLISATATDGSGGVGTGTVSVILDATAPTVSITSPASGISVSTPSITVAGLVNDIVTGTVGTNDVTITVNGQPAAVLNRSYQLAGIQLVPGSNTINVTATDKVGHSSTTSTTVQYVPANRQLSLVLLNGDAQTAPIDSVLPQPLVVQLLAADGTPIVNRPVTFTVTRSNGLVEVMPNTGQSLFVNTDATGKASVLFMLGSRTGLGVNQVTATTPGAAGGILFTASSTSGAATQIHVVRGENQRGLLGEQLPEALQVIVSDARYNPIPGVTVTYTVTAGDGTLDHTSVTTDSNGKAIASLTLGQQEGVGNYIVQANIAGNTGLPITFASSGYAPGPVANTSVSGVVLDNANTPIPNATVRLLGTGLSTVSDTNGRFLIPGAPVGTATLSVDGSTSTRTQTFPFLSFVIQDLPGQNNTLNKPVYLPAVDVNNAQTVGGDDPVTLTMAGVPGVAFTIAPHSVTFPDGSTVGKLSLSQVKSDMVPMEPVNGSAPDLIWTLQPAGTRFSVPVQVTLPNTQARPPGTVTEFFQYDHDLEQFVSAGTMHVSADGSVLTSDPGFGLSKAGWGHGQSVPTQTNCTVSCDDKNECTADSSYDCGCTNRKLTGRACGGSTKTSTCRLPGTCVNGLCNGPKAPDGTQCDDNVFCTDPDKCTNGYCAGTPIAPHAGLGGLSPTALKFEHAFSSGLDPLVVFINTYGYNYGKIEPKFSVDYTEIKSCCEAKRLLNSTQGQTSISAGLSLTFTKILVPSLSFSIPIVGGVGVYVQPAITIGGQVTWNTNDCTDTDCVTGKAGVDVSLEIGVEVDFVNFLVAAGVNSGITANVVVGCHAVISTFGSLDAKLVGTATSKSTGHAYSLEKLLFPAQVIGQTTTNYSAN